jgi:hypothetical protein
VELPTLAQVATAIKDWGPLVAGIGLFLAWYQLRKTVLWNKLNATFSIFSSQRLLDRESAAAKALLGVGIDLYQQRTVLSDDKVNAIIADPTIYPHVKGFLNFLEDYSMAVNVGALDENTAFLLMAEVLNRHYEVFMPLIAKRREAASSPRLWEQLESVVRRWRPRLRKKDIAYLRKYK